MASFDTYIEPNKADNEQPAIRLWPTAVELPVYFDRMYSTCSNDLTYLLKNFEN